MIFKKFVKTLVFIMIIVVFVACGDPNSGETPSTSSSSMEQTYTVTVASGIRYGTLTVDHESATAGTSVGITASPNNTGIFRSLAVMAGDQNVEVTESNSSNSASERHFTFTMPQHNVTVSAIFDYNYPEPTTMILGNANSGHIIYKPTGDSFDFSWVRPDSSINGRTAIETTVTPDAYTAIDHYCAEYENYVDENVENIEAMLANKNEATQTYVGNYLNPVKARAGKYDAGHIDQTLKTIHDGSSFVFCDLINNASGIKERVILSSLIKVRYNENYGKGFSKKNTSTSARYNSIKDSAINNLQNRIKDVNFTSDINNHNSEQTTNILDQKLSSAISYLNQAEGLELDLDLTKALINLGSSADGVAIVLDTKNNSILVFNLNNNLDQAIADAVTIQTQSNN